MGVFLRGGRVMGNVQKFLFGIVALGCGVCIAETSFADAKQFYFERQNNLNEIFENERRGVLPENPLIEQKWFEQRIDHSDREDSRTFRQRYFINRTYVRSSPTPVLYYICGESTCSARYLLGAIAEVAQKTGAMLVALEHRYYGESQPFDQLTTENMKYLTTEQALEDLASFQEAMEDRSGFDGQWIAVGGSYPGSLSAYYRQRYPEKVGLALASSAPVQARENFEEYDHHIFRVTQPSCVAAIRSVVSEVEEIMDRGSAEDLTRVKSLFQANQIKDEVDFLYLIADIAALAIQYGYRDQFCGMLLKEGRSTLQGYSDFARMIYMSWGISALDFVAQGAESLDPKDYLAGFGMRQWFYQSCTEYGYWQNAYHDPSESTRSARINPAFHRGVCERLYGITEALDESKVNETYYEPLLDESTTQIVMTNGSTDPWSNLSILPGASNDLNPHLELFMIEGAAHCDDLGRPNRSDSADLIRAREIFLDRVLEALEGTK